MDETQKAHRSFDRHDAWDTKANELLVQSGALVMRSALILNGAAVIALLAFLSSTIHASGLDDHHRDLVNGIVGILPIFGLGAFMAGICAGFAYLTNYFYLWAHRQRSFHWEEPFIRDKPSFARLTIIGHSTAVLSIICAAISFAAFAAGLWQITEMVG